MIKNSSKPSDGFTESPSSRPMTLRQQLLDIDKLRQTHQIDNPEYIDRLVQVCQEIAREARLDELDRIAEYSNHYAADRHYTHDDSFYVVEDQDLADRKGQLTQKPPQPPQGDSEEPS